MTVLPVALALLVGLSLGVLGGGGSILTLPILLYAVGMAPKPAIATSLLIVAGASFVAMLVHAHRGRVAWRIAGWFGAASTTTAYAAGRLAHGLSGSLLLAAFTGIMLLTGTAMLRRTPSGASGHPRVARVLAAGAGVGTVTGLVGAGGGFLIVPALTLFAGLDMPRAVGTSLLIITLNSLAGFVGYLGHVDLSLNAAAVLTIAAAVGSLFGSALSGRIRPAPSPRLRAVRALDGCLDGGAAASFARGRPDRSRRARDAPVCGAAWRSDDLPVPPHSRSLDVSALPERMLMSQHLRLTPLPSALAKREDRTVARHLLDAAFSQEALLQRAAANGEQR